MLLLTAFQLSASTGKNHSCILHRVTCCFSYYDNTVIIHVSLLFLVIAFTNHYSPPDILAISHLYCKKYDQQKNLLLYRRILLPEKPDFFPVVVCRSKTLQLEVPMSFIKHASNQFKESF